MYECDIDAVLYITDADILVNDEDIDSETNSFVEKILIMYIHPRFNLISVTNFVSQKLALPRHTNRMCNEEATSNRFIKHFDSLDSLSRIISFYVSQRCHITFSR